MSRRYLAWQPKFFLITIDGACRILRAPSRGTLEFQYERQGIEAVIQQIHPYDGESVERAQRLVEWQRTHTRVLSDEAAE